MRKIAVALVAFSLVTVACSKKTDTGGTSTTPTGTTTAATAAACLQGLPPFLNDDTLTVGTSEPAYPPYFQGGTPKGSEWTINDPNTGKGFESAVAYEVAKRLGYSADQVKWFQVKFAQSYAPGPKTFDIDINQTSYSPKRAQAVDFSDSYYDVQQALVAVKGTPIAQATTVADLKPYTLAAPLGTTSYDLITDVVKPDHDPGVYQTEADAVAAINAGQIDGLVVDYPTALYMADPYVQQVHNSVVVGTFANPAGATPDHFGIVMEKGSGLTPCVNLALAEMKADGTLQAITQEWLSEKTNVGEVPVFSP